MKLSNCCAFCLLLFFFFIHSSVTANQCPYPEGQLRVPQGFNITVYADGLENARQIAVSPRSGNLFVGSFQKGVVYLVQRIQGQKVVTPILSKLHFPVGVVYDDQSDTLYVSTVQTIFRVQDIEQKIAQGQFSQIKEVPFIEGLPTKDDHGWKYLKISPDRQLFVPVGSPCNTCLLDQDIYGTITAYSLQNGTKGETWVRGMRNSVGFDWDSQGTFFFSENGRDNWQPDMYNRPGDELNRVEGPGKHYGFPFCYEKDLPDTEYNPSKDCSPYVPAAYVLAPHAAALGMTFYRGESFPQRYGKDVAFVAEHGSWNRPVKSPTGFRVVAVDTKNPQSQPEVFLDGFLKVPQSGENDSPYAFGRPVDVINFEDGFLVSDDKCGKIYQIQYTG